MRYSYYLSSYTGIILYYLADYNSSMYLIVNLFMPFFGKMQGRLPHIRCFKCMRPVLHILKKKAIDMINTNI